MTRFTHNAWAAVLGAAVLCVGSCAQMEEMPAMEEEQGVRVVHFNATEIRSKAAFGEAENGVRPTLWTANDTELKLSLNYGTAVAAAVTPSQDHVTASFDATIDFSNTTGPYTFYAVSPSSSAKALSPSREAWKVSIPCVQTPSALSADEGAVIIAAESESFASAASISSVSMSFTHLTAYGRFSLENLSLEQGETVSAVELTVTTPIVGDWYWACTEGEGGHALTDYGASSTLTIHTSSTSDLWFGCAPVEVGDEALVVDVYTNLGVYEQLTAFPAGCKFTAGECAVFSVDMDGADFTAAGSGGSGSGSGAFELVTDASTLAVGDEVLIVYTSGSKALGASAGNFRSPVDVTISNNAISSPGEATVLTLVAGNASGTWAFKDGSDYLTSPSTADNYLRNSTSITDNSSWEITIASGGLATINAQGGSRTYLLYNINSPRFSCYDSANKTGMGKVSIYRRTSSGGVSADNPLLSETNYGCYLGTGLEWEYNPGTDQVTRSYDEYGFETYTLIKPSNVEELEIIGYKKGYIKGDGNISISVKWRRGTSTVLSEDYKMTIIKEDGPKVWLSDGTHGVIIKK